MRYLILLLTLLLFSVSSCYSRYVQKRHVPETCVPSELHWLDSTPDVDPFDAACEEYTRRTRADAKALLKPTLIYVRRHTNNPTICAGTPFETCTLKLAANTYYIEYRADPAHKQYLWHEVLHVLLSQAGHPASTHHLLMFKYGWIHGSLSTRPKFPKGTLTGPGSFIPFGH